jgi:hypothetical protein
MPETRASELHASDVIMRRVTEQAFHGSHRASVTMPWRDRTYERGALWFRPHLLHGRVATAIAERASVRRPSGGERRAAASGGKRWHGGERWRAVASGGERWHGGEQWRAVASGGTAAMAATRSNSRQGSASHRRRCRRRKLGRERVCDRDRICVCSATSGSTSTRPQRHVGWSSWPRSGLTSLACGPCRHRANNYDNNIK